MKMIKGVSAHLEDALSHGESLARARRPKDDIWRQVGAMGARKHVEHSCFLMALSIEHLSDEIWLAPCLLIVEDA